MVKQIKFGGLKLLDARPYCKATQVAQKTLVGQDRVRNWPIHNSHLIYDRAGREIQWGHD